MSFPQFDARYVPQAKVTEYFLSTATQKAAGRYKFFVARGFERQAWRVLHDALLAHPIGASVALARQDAYGDTWCATGPLRCPDGTAPVIRSFWIIRHDDPRPQLTSAIPDA